MYWMPSTLLSISHVETYWCTECHQWHILVSWMSPMTFTGVLDVINVTYWCTECQQWYILVYWMSPMTLSGVLNVTNDTYWCTECVVAIKGHATLLVYWVSPMRHTGVLNVTGDTDWCPECHQWYMLVYWMSPIIRTGLLVYWMCRYHCKTCYSTGVLWRSHSTPAVSCLLFVMPECFYPDDIEDIKSRILSHKKYMCFVTKTGEKQNVCIRICYFSIETVFKFSWTLGYSWGRNHGLASSLFNTN